MEFRRSVQKENKRRRKMKEYVYVYIRYYRYI